MNEQKNTAPAEDSSDKTDLTQFKTLDLLNELSSRQGIEKAQLGPFQLYELKRKFSEDRAPIETGYILIVSHEGLSE